MCPSLCPLVKDDLEILSIKHFPHAQFFFVSSPLSQYLQTVSKTRKKKKKIKITRKLENVHDC